MYGEEVGRHERGIVKVETKRGRRYERLEGRNRERQGEGERNKTHLLTYNLARLSITGNFPPISPARS